MSNAAYREAGTVDAGEPLPVNPVDEQQMNRFSPEKLELIGKSLAGTRDKWVASKQATGVERRWMEDLDQYLGRDAATKQASDMMDTVENGGMPAKSAAKKIQRSTVFVNITRPKTNAVEARLSSMLYPSDDKAWGIRPTIRPSLSMKAMHEARGLYQKWNQPAPQQAPQQGQGPMQQPTPAQVPGVPGGIQPAADTSVNISGSNNQIIGQTFVKTEAQAEIDVAKAAAKAMEGEISDALTECDFAQEARKMLHDVAVLGTGCMKGPIVVSRVAKVWQKVQGSNVYALQIAEDLRPASEHVSPWNLYPDPTCGNDIHNGKGIFEKKNLTGKMLRDLVGQPGYMEEQIAKVLEQGPRRSTSLNERDVRDKESMGNEPMYECWEYWGDFDPEDLSCCGVEIPEGTTKVVSGCIIMVNDIIIKGFLNPLECGSLPYDFMVMEEADNSPWGYGVPFLCRPAQRVLNAAWRQMMDNAGLSVGPIVVLKPNLVQPADQNWQITGRKIFNCMDDSADVRTAFNLFEIPNHSEQFEKIIQLAMMFADEESSVPKITQGNAQSDSVGVTTIQMNSANVVLGRLVKQYDDRITRRHIRRYYDFFMAYSEKDEIKGDFQVDARGSTVLLVRDQQVQSLMQFGQFQATPIAPMVNWHKWIREVLKAQNLDPFDILKSDAEIEQIVSQPPGPTPEQVKAAAQENVAKIRADAQLRSAESREKTELAFVDAQAQMARDNAIARVKELETKRDLEILKYANDQKVSLETAKSQLAQTALIEETKRQIAAAKIELEHIQSDKGMLIQPTSQGASNGK